MDLARQNVQVVLGDIERTTGLRPTFTVDAYMNVVRIAYRQDSTTPSVFATTNPEALVETVAYLQDHVAEDIWFPWPVCAIHDKGLYAEVHGGEAAWWCRFGGHLVAPVGSLGVKGA